MRVLLQSPVATLAATTSHLTHSRMLLRNNLAALLLLPAARFTPLAPPARMLAAPRRGAAVDSYQTVSVLCSKCSMRLFKYKKKNGLKSNLVKCYVERICEDSAGVLAVRAETGVDDASEWLCPKCGSGFARTALIHCRLGLSNTNARIPPCNDASNNQPNVSKSCSPTNA